MSRRSSRFHSVSAALSYWQSNCATPPSLVTRTCVNVAALSRGVSSSPVTTTTTDVTLSHYCPCSFMFYASTGYTQHSLQRSHNVFTMSRRCLSRCPSRDKSNSFPPLHNTHPPAEAPNDCGKISSLVTKYNCNQNDYKKLKYEWQKKLWEST